MVSSINESARILRRWDGDGLVVRTDGEPLQVDQV
jgi:hypothetical protein